MANTRVTNGEHGNAKERKASEPTRRRSHTRGGEQADWESVDADLIRRAISTVGSKGGAVRFGYSRDGGAYAIAVYDNGAGETEYYPPSTDMSEVLKGVIEDFG